MRILNRPMFKYGGPIKEGVMHGMRDGGRIGFKDGTKKDTRTSFEKNILNMPPPNMTREEAEAYLYNYGSLGSAIGSGGQELMGLTNDMLGNYGLNPLLKAGSWITGIGKDRTKNLPSYNTKQGMIDKWSGTIRDDKGNIISTNTKIPTDQVIDAAASGKVPGHGDEGMTYTDPNKAKKLAKDAQNKRLKSYLDMMGYDSAKKTAMSDALIDASALVQDATTEAGSIKKADWGKLINRAIQTTSKRLDKPEQIREAVGLMSVKAAIQKDLEDPQVKKLRALQIEDAEEKLNTGFEKDMSEFIFGSKTAPDKTQLERYARLKADEHGLKFTMITDEIIEKIPEDATEKERMEKAGIVDDGIYMIGSEIIRVKDGKIKQIA